MELSSNFLGLDVEIPEIELVVGDNETAVTSEPEIVTSGPGEGVQPGALVGPQGQISAEITAQQSLIELQQINSNLNLIVNGLVPVIGATVIVIWLCRWFHKRFFDRA